MYCVLCKHYNIKCINMKVPEYKCVKIVNVFLLDFI